MAGRERMTTVAGGPSGLVGYPIGMGVTQPARWVGLGWLWVGVGWRLGWIWVAHPAVLPGLAWVSTWSR